MQVEIGNVSSHDAVGLNKKCNLDWVIIADLDRAGYEKDVMESNALLGAKKQLW
jgi:hypothetical protein